MANSHKKSLLLFFLIALFCSATLPLLNIIKNPEKIDRSSLYNTDVIESHINYWIYKILNKSTNPENLIVGKNDRLFLGNKHNKLVYKTIGVYPYSERQIENWSGNLLKLQQWYENQGIEFLLVLTPNKHSIYPEELPNWVRPVEYSLTDRLVSASHTADINLLDLRPTLLKNKKNYPHRLYWKTDSHWNQLGAALGFEAVIERINKLFKSRIETPNFTFKSKAVQLKGGSAGFLKIQKLLPLGFENEISIRVEDENEVCWGRIDVDTLQSEPCTMKLRPYINVHEGPAYVINEQALNEDKVLILADSFYGLKSNLYHKTFQTTWVHRYNHILGNDLEKFISTYQPNRVIYQVVERSLFNNYFIDIKSPPSN